MFAAEPLRSNRSRSKVARPATVPAPVGGWDAQSPLAAMPKDRAVQLDDWFPQPGWVEVRKGYDWHAWDIGSNVVTVSNVDTTDNELDSNSHGLTNGKRVKVYSTGTIPGGLSLTRTYWVVAASTNSFSLALTEGGAEVDISSAGSGTIYAYEVADDEAVESLPVWEGMTGRKMFAAAGGALWDVTASQAAFPVLTGLGSDRWQHVNFVNAAATYLYMVNGVDAPVHFNGSAWATPTINNITEADAIGINVHKKRIWFVMRDSTKAAYLDVDAIQGDATEFDLGSTFTKGGVLMAMATWTRDGGSGPDDYAVFISSMGQIALYQGTDPDEAETWSLVGVFDAPPPIGRRCFARYGADVLLITIEGVYPLSQVLSVDKSQAKRVAITLNISNAMNTAAALYRDNFGWEICIYPKGTRLFLNIPLAEGEAAEQYVMNTLKPAWCRFRNHNACCWAVFGENLYFGGSNGGVFRADIGSADIDQPIVAVGQTAYGAFQQPGTLKRFTMLQPLVTADGTDRPSLGISTDFNETQELSTSNVSQASSSALWDSAQWDVASWGGEVLQINDWISVPALGRFASIKFRAQTGAQSGGSVWGVSQWGINLWGGAANREQIMRINGFIPLYEIGDYV